ncbi:MULTISPECIES: polysaccharide biosynthesis protein [unclassified Clostridium]|jgi:stage V sporulation protein B|uniref:putative polysaccharide biosynthesis protein n=1 Tax=unclassified Clostridium TaxID=2614128 RepID=UPI001C8B79DF|nr:MULTISPECIES: polysaccharide biosynthesis protein [unclassified Clostridium]MBX9137313.1 polysaccharide biosynthesis protein [Clostridium sp. K12(2020)]MBX9144124.1 polysaccharide biosynthesis protein [Clostridium sp. K13]MDU2291456.1 polysaccharide biosynthesis protein [Clostridium celatum]MDU4324711.1 polysaccharide biosynthesis protein [Clostridium celatum]
MKKQSLIKGSLVLGLAGMVAKVLGFFFRWPLIMLIGDEGIGYYQLSYPLYMFFVAMASGVPVAVSKMISEKNAVGDIEGSYEVVKESSYLMMTLGIGTSIILFLFAKPIINFLKWDMKSYYALIGISFAPMMVSFVSIFRGFFQGLQNMTPSGTSQILEQIGRVIIGVGLAYILLPKGIEYSAGGAAFGAAGGAMIACLYLWFKYLRVRREMGIKKVKTNTEVLNQILKIAIPISLGATVGTIMNLIDSILVPQKLIESGVVNATALYGQLTGKAAVLVNIPLTLSMAICTSLIPIISEHYILNRKEEMQSKINIAMKLSAVIALPCALGMFCLAGPIMKLVFFDKYEGIEILRYLSISIPFIIVTQTTTSILQATNHYIRPVINLVIGCIVKVVLTATLVPIPSINVFGAVIASIAAYVVVTILNLIALKTKAKCKVSVYDSFIKPGYASVAMITVVLFSYNFIMERVDSNSISCLLSIFMGIIIYMIAILIFKVFEVDEIKNRLARK